MIAFTMASLSTTDSVSTLKGVPTARLDGKVALVTGAGRGIGRGVAVELGQRGASVVINYSKSVETANVLVREIEESGVRAIAVQADITRPKEITRLFEEAKFHFGHIDIVVSNAGIEHFSQITDVTPEQFDTVFDINTRAQFFVAKNAFTYLEDGGRLILLSSMSAHVGLRYHALYEGSKSAVEAFSRCFVKEFGDKKVTVNTIAPGGVKTDMAAAAGWRYIPGADPSWTVDDVDKFMSANTPLHRMGLANDVARVIAFLSSTDGGWINGKPLALLRTRYSSRVCHHRSNNCGFRRCDCIVPICRPDL